MKKSINNIRKVNIKTLKKELISQYFIVY